MGFNKQLFIFPERFGFFPYVFLIYLVLPTVDISKEKGVKLVIGYLLLIVFLVSYRQLYFCMGMKKYSYWLGIQMGIILLLSLFYNPNNLFMGFFPANFIGYYVRKRNFYLALIVFAVMQSIPLLINIENTSLKSIISYIPFFVIMLMSPFGIRSMIKRMELEKQLDFANEQINELVKREERMRIARDLHDTLGHTLSLITLKSQLVGKLAVHKPEQAQTEAKEIEKISRSALKQVRELVSDMRAITIAEELVEIQTILKAAGIAHHIEADLEKADVPPLTQNIISLCLREAVTNVVKHSSALNCTIKINHKLGKVDVFVIDDGVGLTDNRKAGNGLKGMKERLELLEGKLHLSSQEGTNLHITVPIIVKERKEGMAF
ncbi:sensor histidine kinase [Niallia sp. 01092]|uniref:sensor histidine kinase n=1 Tax=unclassified Niallia TaxID=2837522 RepID=UPI003FD0CD59